MSSTVDRPGFAALLMVCEVGRGSHTLIGIRCRDMNRLGAKEGDYQGMSILTVPAAIGLSGPETAVRRIMRISLTTVRRIGS